MEEYNETINDVFICQCSNTEHQLIFVYDKDWDEVFVSVHLNHMYSFWKRVWAAIKYIFGYRSKYGHFDEFIFKKSDSKKLQKIVDFLNCE